MQEKGAGPAWDANKRDGGESDIGKHLGERNDRIESEQWGGICRREKNQQIAKRADLDNQKEVLEEVRRRACQGW